MTFPELKKAVSSKWSDWCLIRRKTVDLREQKIQAEQKHNDTLEAQDLTQQVAQQIQQMAHNQIASVVSQCLEAVFDEPYEFKIQFDRKRGKTEANLIFSRNGVEVDPMTASGGGVVDVASFALRLSCLMLSRPPVRRVLFLDEPFKFLSEEYRDRVRGLLEKLSADLQVQFIMVTHIQELKTGTIVNLG